jgi:3'-phosphoadenosine 5'-phosphosulfate sulfotransferase (PAPS reductase)/FAD synthetase
VRKVLPLRDKLAEVDCWITGLRRDQSLTRAECRRVGALCVTTNPSGRDIVKLNPMAGWSREAVWDYLRRHRIPYNPLHDRGYRSIGCQPCTRQTQQRYRRTRRPLDRVRQDRVRHPHLSYPRRSTSKSDLFLSRMDNLTRLENQSIYIFREAFSKFEQLAMLWSIGKDSTVLLWLARKAFFGRVPFPLVHVDTTYKIPSMIEYRDQLGPQVEPPTDRRQK